MKSWVNTISRDHVDIGVEGGFTQAGHGKASGLKSLNAGDWLVFYSPLGSARIQELVDIERAGSTTEAQ